MNRVNNWLIVAALFFVLAMATMTFFNVPAVAWGLAVPCLAALAMALIRYEDFRKANDVDFGSVA